MIELSSIKSECIESTKYLDSLQIVLLVDLIEPSCRVLATSEVLTQHAEARNLQESFMKE